SFGAWLRWRDSKALREALEAGDIKTAVKIRSK
ncbi:holin, partial [Klebsiella phage vB_KpnS-VAC9]